MRRLAILVLFAAAAACGGTGVFDAAEETGAFLEQTAAGIDPSRTYELEVGGPTSAWCSEPDDSPDRSEVAVRQRLDIDLRPGDDPAAMARQVVDRWEDMGLSVAVDGWGTGSVAGATRNDRGDSFGFAAVDADDDDFDVLELSSVTACHARP